jgi:pyruvate,orthophosphate dikinase
MEAEKKDWQSSALKVNLERTAATVEIPEHYLPLLAIVDEYYGLSRKTRKLLTELAHPFVNWEYVLTELKTISIGDFYYYNMHGDGRTALSLFLQIYFDIIRLAPEEDTKDSTLQYLFEYINTVVTNSGEMLPRNLLVFPFVVESLCAVSQEQGQLLKKSSGYLKKTLRLLVEKGIDTSSDGMATLLYELFKQTYQFWLAQPNPAVWFHREGESEDAINTYRTITYPLSHDHLQLLLERLETLHQPVVVGESQSWVPYLDMPDYSQIVNGYLLIADELEKASVYTGRQHLVKLDFLFNIMSVPSLSDVHGRALREINLCLRMVFKEKKH